MLSRTSRSPCQASCGTVVGTLDSEAAIEGLQKQIAAIDAGLVRIVKALQEQ